MSKEKRMCTFYEGAGKPFKSDKQDRNAKCKCNSGKKAKNCCGCETNYYTAKVPEVSKRQEGLSTEEEVNNE